MRSFLLLATLLIGINVLAQKSEISGGPLKPEQANMDVRHYNISLDLDPENKTFKGYTDVKLDLAASTKTIMLDLSSNFQISALMVDGKKTPYTHQDGLITITAATPFNSGSHLVKIQYSGQPVEANRPPWDGGVQWTKDSLGRHWIAMSCQVDGADLFFPCKDHPSDEPNEGADLIISVPKGLVVAGPGLLLKQSGNKTKSVFHWKTNYTINSYNIVFNVGYYSVVRKTFTTVDGKKVPMEYYVMDYNRNRAEKHLDLLERSAKLLERYFGEYPWVKEKIGVVETPHLGMEHQTMNAYGNKYRYVKMGEVDFDWLLTHEFGHEWWGNKVTNIDWAHMWIHEGICSYADALFYEEYGGRKAYLNRMKASAINFSNKLPVVQGSVIDSRQTYHADIYTKGAYFMHTLRYVMGDSAFFPAIKSFATNPQFTYDNFVTTENLLLHFNTAARRNLRPLFDLFLNTTDRLQVNIKQTKLDTFEIKLLNLDMDIPIDIITSAGPTKIIVGKNPVRIRSEMMPSVDPDGFYFKKIIIE